jgi:hypothetical protein
LNFAVRGDGTGRRRRGGGGDVGGVKREVGEVIGD